MKRKLIVFYPMKILIFLFLIFTSATCHTSETKPVKPLAPGYGKLGFPAPEAGTYRLPLLGKAGDGNVLDSEGRASTLHRLMSGEAGSGKIVLLSFIYSTCSDVNGCPLATAVFHKIKNRLKHEPELAGQLRLLTLSFNPEYDTPERMKEYGASLQSKELEWLFLTAPSEQELRPILKGYGQTAEKVFDRKGKFTNTFNHQLRVYLIDRNKQLRNIYNTELLHPDTLISDIKTLLRPEPDTVEAQAKLVDKPALFTSGDNKSNYETQDYRTSSIALKRRQGHAADLLTTINKPSLGLPSVPVPQDNTPTSEKSALGRKLFYDRRLSINNTFSCAMCHIPEQGFTSNEMATAVGVEGRTVRRNSPTLFNVAYRTKLFHDGRESTLEQQVWGPFLAQNEMANPSIGYVIDKIKLSADYNGLFEQAFGKPPGMETVGMAIASYERALNSANSRFDRWYFGKDKQALSEQARRGFGLFTGKAGCGQCHSINKEQALFTDNGLHNTGIGYEAAMAKAPALTRRVQVAPGVYTEVPNEIIGSVSEAKANDLGRYEVSQKPEDRWKYTTPSLRNIALTAPYMHNGSLATLKEVVEFYNRGGVPNENLDPLIKPLTLNPRDIADLVDFLNALTGDNVEELVSDAFAAPVGDVE